MGAAIRGQGTAATDGGVGAEGELQQGDEAIAVRVGIDANVSEGLGEVTIGPNPILLRVDIDDDIIGMRCRSVPWWLRMTG